MVVGVIGAVFEMLRERAALASLVSLKSVSKTSLERDSIERRSNESSFGVSYTSIAAVSESPHSRRGILNIDDDDEKRSDFRGSSSGTEPETHEEVAVLGSPSELIPVEEEEEKEPAPRGLEAHRARQSALGERNTVGVKTNESLPLFSRNRGDDDHRPSSSRRQVLEARWRSILDDAEAEAELVAVRHRTKKKLP